MTAGNPPESAATSDADGVDLGPFLAAYTADRAAGCWRTLAYYIGLCPGREAEVAERFASLLADEGSGGEGPPPAIGPYRIERELGRGAQGVVYLATDPRLSRPVAVKVLSGRGFTDAVTRARFLREARVAGRLEHPNLCAVHDTGMHDGDPYLVLRYVDGEPLSRARAPTGTTSAGVVAIVHLVEKLARAVHAAHEAGVVHRDLKPGNVMLDRGGEPVVLDFGLAHDDGEEMLTRVTDRIGTPAYMAPEQLDPAVGPVDRRADIWSLGVILWERLLGQRPFQAPTTTSLGHAVLHASLPDPRRVNRLVPRDLAVVLTTALQRSPDARYGTAFDLAEDLRLVRAGLPILARPPGPVVCAARWVARNRLLSVLGTALLFSLALGLALSIRANRDLSTALAAAQWRADAHTLEVHTMNNRQVWRRDENDLWMIDLTIRRFEELLARRDAHAAQFAPIAADDGLSRQRLQDLLVGLDRLRDDEFSPLGWLRHKRQLVHDERRVTLDDAMAAWDRALVEIAAHPGYGGVPAQPQLGLLPLGRDPVSGLQEFALWRSGRTPTRDGSGRLSIEPGSALVLVLVPRGTLPVADERPAIAVEPFLVGKHEVTLAQWTALTGPLGPREPEDDTQQLPFTGIQYENWYEQLHCNGLRLPDEVQWEYAARAGAVGQWPDGDDPAGAAGIVGRPGAAMVGMLAPNAFGLHDVIGNVAEFCQDADDQIAKAPGRPHFHRGGHHADRVEATTVTTRGSLFGRSVSPLVGARASRPWR